MSMDRREFLKATLVGMGLLVFGTKLPEQKKLVSRQAGGCIKPGQFYIVGRGHPPELFISEKAGIVISHPTIWYCHGGTTWTF